MDRTSNEARLSLFETELSLIQDKSLRSLVEYVLKKLPEYFFHVPASSSGKYHPAYALGEGGLVRHTKAAVRIFTDLTRAGIDEWYMNMDTYNPDLYSKDAFDSECIAALILHDSIKYGEEEIPLEDIPNRHTMFEHPLLAATFLMKCAQEVGYENGAQVERVVSLISSHMGKWCYSKYSTCVLPTPDMGGWGHKMVHLADYLASRKELEYNFYTDWSSRNV